MTLFQNRKGAVPWFLLLLAALALFSVGCGKAGSKGDGSIPDLTGTWVSPERVDPSIEFKIENLISQVSLNGETYYYYNGSVKCSILEDGLIEITQAPTYLELDDSIIIIDSYLDTISIRAGFSTRKGGKVILEGRPVGASLDCHVKILNNRDEVIYETEKTILGDIFEPPQ